MAYRAATRTIRKGSFALPDDFLGSRQWVNERGEPHNIYSPRLIVALAGQVSGGK